MSNSDSLGHAHAQAAAANGSRRRVWFQVLVILDAFVLGGCVALLMVHQLLLSIMGRLVSASAAAEILNVLDHLLPYYVAYAGALLLMAPLTVGAWILTRGPRAGTPGALGAAQRR